VNALAQGALRRVTTWIEHPTLQLGGGHSITELIHVRMQIVPIKVSNAFQRINREIDSQIVFYKF